MATVNPTTSSGDPQSNDGSVIVITWGPLTTANANGQSVIAARFADKTVTFTGTFGAGGTVKLQGSNDPLSTVDGSATWFDLTDPQGNALSKTAAALEAVSENPLRVRPFVSAGDGTTSLTAILVARQSNTLRT